MPLPIPSTSTNPLQDQVNHYYNRLQIMYNLLQQTYVLGDSLLYANSEGYASSTVAAALGTSGQSVLQWQSILSQTLQTIAGQPPVSASTGFVVTNNQDGSIGLLPPGNPLSTLGGGGNQPA